MKKVIAKIIIVLVLITIGALGYVIYNTFLEAEAVRNRIAQLPELEVISLINNHANTPKPQPIIVNYFSSTCPYCKEEIRSIRQHGELLSSAWILFISDEPKNKILDFSKSFGLDTIMVDVAWDSVGWAKQFFAVESVPATFVYRADSSLIKSFKGEVKAELLYELIK